MRKHEVAVAGLIVLAAAAGAQGQVIQLPTLQYFTVQTSVLAPDRGGASLGQVRRSSRGRVARGVPGVGKIPGFGRLFGNRAIGGGDSRSGASVHVTVTDHRAMDEALLEAAAGRDAGLMPDARRAMAIARQLQPGAGAASAPDDENLLSVAEHRRRNAQRQSSEVKAARAFLAQGRAAEAKGQPGVAKILYRMAQKRADEALQPEIAADLARLERQTAGATGAGGLADTR